MCSAFQTWAQKASKTCLTAKKQTKNVREAVKHPTQQKAVNKQKVPTHVLPRKDVHNICNVAWRAQESSSGIVCTGFPLQATVKKELLQTARPDKSGGLETRAPMTPVSCQRKKSMIDTP